jgi:hypothetical protein
VSQKESNSELMHFDVAISESVKPLFDHLVGAGKQRRGQFEAECSGRFEIYGQLVLRRLLHRQISSTRAF